MIDANALRQAAHTLKSSSAIFGATALSQLCRDMEAEAKERVDPDAPARLTAIEAVYGDVERALQAELARLATP